MDGMDRLDEIDGWNGFGGGDGGNIDGRTDSTRRALALNTPGAQAHRQNQARKHTENSWRASAPP